jgi:hypothetical protein
MSLIYSAIRGAKIVGKDVTILFQRRTGGPRYMCPFHLQVRLFTIKNWSTSVAEAYVASPA